ncbi:MAG: glycosyltransferase family 39 protein [Candidatus Peribacteraceae bacterium]|jgi:4-amino-4-deoxy-L-arabinose transferase-like glycosyltransferase|nr:glycosyltransferase family 39 protein [Candidatus Peribacteraceae bacterium]MDP7645949.1 glycosyltransferase family 39 protein [Candidatus Peribacteraceae bacterium]
MALASRKLIFSGVFIAGSLIYLFCLAYLQPSFSDVQYRTIETTKVNGVDYIAKYSVFTSESKKLDEPPFIINSGYSLFEVSMKMHARAIHPRIYEIKVDDCLLGIDINAEEQEIVSRSCLYPFPHHIDFSRSFHEGENSVVMIARNNGGRGSVYINTSYKDPIVFGLHTCYFLFLCLIAYLIISKVRKKEIRILYSIVFGGIFLRFIYLITTPFLVREYDTSGHLQYIRYLHQHWFWIPSANAGWEYSQPPLYYWLASLFSLPAKIFGTDMAIITSLRIFSFILSILVLFISVWLAQMLFKERNSLWKKCIFVSVFAVLPGIVFLATRVSNDTMFLFVGMLFFAFLLRWWKEGKQKDLYTCFVLLGLCLLTKNNSIALIPVVFVTILLKKKITWKQVLKYFVICAVIISLMVGWLYAKRIVTQGEFKIVGNVDMVTHKLKVDIKPSNFITYKLTEVLKKPYHYSFNDETRRMIYWEVLLKSTFTGEWNMGERVHSIMRVIHTVNSVLLLVVVLALAQGFIVSPRKNAPLWALLIFLILAQIGIVAKEGFNGLQKFRYVTLITIPVTYYFVAGLSMLDPRIRRLLLWLFWFFVLLCIIFTFVVIASNRR